MKSISSSGFFRAIIYRKSLVIVLGIALIIRIIVFLYLVTGNPGTGNTLFNNKDATGYHRIATEIVSGKSLTSLKPFRTPGYPLFLATVYSIAGIDTSAVVLIQILINLATVLLVYTTTRLFFNNRVGIMAALFYAFDPHVVFYTYTILADTLFLFLIVSGIYVLLKNHSTRILRAAIISGILFGLATYVKPIGLWLPLVIILPLLTSKNWSGLLKMGSTMILVYLFVLSPWFIRNYNKYNVPGFSTISSHNLYYFNVGLTKAFETGRPYSAVRSDLKEQYDVLLSECDGNIMLVSKRINKISRKYLSHNTRVYIPLHLRGIRNTLITQNKGVIFEYFRFGPYKENGSYVYREGSVDTGFPLIGMKIIAKNFFRDRPGFEILTGLSFLLYMVFIYLLFFIGVVRLYKYGQTNFLLTMLLVIGYFLLLTGIVGHARYKLPIIPFYSMVAAVGYEVLVRHRSSAIIPEHKKG